MIQLSRRLTEYPRILDIDWIVAPESNHLFTNLVIRRRVERRVESSERMMRSSVMLVAEAESGGR